MSFDQSVSYLIQNEGTYVNNPSDGGGPTNFGVTKKMMEFYRATDVTEDDVKNLTLDEAKAIYKKYYWDRLGLEGLPYPIATAIFDMSVNMGESTTIMLAQKSMGTVNPDGVMGPQTAMALLHADTYGFIFNFISEVVDHYTNIVLKNPKDLVFLKGWLRRAIRLFHLAE